MRECLKISQSTLSHSASLLSQEVLHRITEKMEEWNHSDYAGFRRLVREGSDCYPDLFSIEKTASSHREGSTGKKIRDFVILGIGGSSLGAEAILRALHSPLLEPRFHIADNSDPASFDWLLQGLAPEETLFFVVAKSGGTPETLSEFLVALDWLKSKLPKGKDGWKKHLVLCTDPAKGDLREVARRWNLSALEVPPAVGGRFSVLSAVGLFPAAYAGLPIRDFLNGAASVANWERQAWSENPAAQLGIALVKNSTSFPITVLMPYSSQLSAFSRWFCQLWGESLGKNGLGLTPFPAVGATDQHSQMQLYMEGPRDKCIIFMHVKEQQKKLPIPFPEELSDLNSFSMLKGKSVSALLDAEFRATRDAISKQGIPNCTVEIDFLDPYSLGALFYFWETATAVAGAMLNINPFDQPGVEAAKVLTKKYLAENR